MDFLIFPEDKTEYIPAVITTIIFMSGAILAMYFFIKQSKKEGKRIDEKYHLNHNNEGTGSDDNDDNKKTTKS